MDRGTLLALTALLTCAGYQLLMAGEVDANGEDDSAPDLLDYASQAQDTLDTYFEQGDEMNKAAFLQALRLGEGTSRSDGYVLLCGGGTLSSFSDHPGNLGWGGWQMPLQMAVNAGYPNGAVSTAAGAYQINKPTWNRIAKKIGLTDFSPASQDAAAWELIGEKGAQADVLAGRIGPAVVKLGKLWASLPGAAAQQRQVTMAALSDAYTNAGGTLG